MKRSRLKPPQQLKVKKFRQFTSRHIPKHHGVEGINTITPVAEAGLLQGTTSRQFLQEQQQATLL